MTKYRVAWSGVARRQFAVEKPGDCLYLLWSGFREVLEPGAIEIDVDGGVTFPVRLAAEIEAADMQEAVTSFRSRHSAYRIGGDVTVEEVRP